jgi:starch synthase
VRRAFALYHRKAEWSRVRQTGMKIAFDWTTAAGHYTDLYRRLIQE